MSKFNADKNRAVWFDIPVADLDRARSFYSKVLAIEVHRDEYDGNAFCVLDHKDGNGGCLIPDEQAVRADGGILVYLNAEGRIRDAISHVEALGGSVLQPIHAIGPHGYRAIIRDSEGNRIALHSNVDA